MKVTFNLRNIQKINENAKLALIDTAESIKTDLIQSQTMPFDSGTMQNDSTDVDDSLISKGNAKIVVDTAYSRKIYFDPEINIKQDKNPNAKQYYFDDYTTGEKKDLPIKHFKKHLKRRQNDG